MKSKIPLIVAVAGALLIGGATTGSTRASWTSQAPLQQHSVSSGQMSYTATTPAGVTVNKVANSTADTTFVLDDTSFGKNLRQRITASVARVPTGVTATIGTTCPGAASVAVNTTPTSPDQTLCVRVTSSTSAVSGDVIINLSSAQQPVAGWTTPTISRSVVVTVTLTAPTLVCGSRANSNEFTMSWQSVPGATSYSVWRSPSNLNDASYVSQGTQTSPYQASIGTDGTSYWRVKAMNSAGTSAFSNTIKIVRAGTDSRNFNCGAP